MATAFFFRLGNLLASLQALVGAFVPRSAPVPRAAVRVPAQRPTPVVARPLRVLRVVEPMAPRTIAGRMVISGRLADVCAELDRLAALEARG